MQFRKALRGRDVHVVDRLRVDDQPLDRRLRLVDQRPQAVHDVPGVGKDQRRVEPIDEQAGNALRFLVLETVVELAVAAQAAKHRVIGTRNLDQHRDQRQQQTENDPGTTPASRIAAGDAQGNAALDTIDLVQRPSATPFPACRWR
jgi:hypothetical protein